MTEHFRQNPSFDLEQYRNLGKFRKVPSEYIGKMDLIYVESESQLYRFKRSIKDGLVFYCSVQKCNAQLLLRNEECLKHCLSSRHNHPEVDPQKIKNLEIIGELKNEVQSSTFNWNSKNKWNKLFTQFEKR